MLSSRYVPWMPIATGGMAEIWLGVLEGAAGYKRAVVMKRAIGQDAATLERARSALTEEARLLANLSHANIVHSYALVELGDDLYFVMEYLPGLSGRALYRMAAEKETRVPMQVTYRILADIARGLAHAHRATDSIGSLLTIVHGDVSPDNFVVTEAGISKVVDFGIARIADRSYEDKPLGKAVYASPEQLRGEPMTSASDVYSLGVVARELLATPAIASAVRDMIPRMLVESAEHRTLTMDEIANVFESSAQDLGAGHADVAVFLRAEFAATLHSRRLRMRLLLEKPAPVAPKTARASTDSTTVAVDALLDDMPIADTGPKHQRIGDNKDE